MQRAAVRYVISKARPMIPLRRASYVDRLSRHILPLLLASFLSMLALVFVAAKARAQQQAEPAELPTVQVTTTQPGKAKGAKKKSGASSPAVVQSAQPPVEAAAADPATALGTFNPALDLPGLELPPGTTLATAGPVYGYQALSAMSSTKTATPIEQIPQSIQVIPKSVIEDQRNLSVNEAVRNASNVQGFYDLGIGNTDLQPMRIRGFSAEQWLDGLAVNYNAGDRDAFANVERIEVLKGPSAILYGGGPGAPVGGAINVISKLPTNVAGGEVGLIFGSDDYMRPYFDVNQPLSKDGTVLFRLTGEYTSADSFIDVLERDSYSVNPTLTLTNKTDTTLTIQGRKSKFEQQAYQGLPVTGTIVGDFRLDPDLYIGNHDIPRSYSEVEGVTVTFDHRFDSVWSFNVKGRWSQSKFDQKSQSAIDGTFTGAEPIFDQTWAMANVQLKQAQEEFTINPNLQARFETGAVRNTVLVGADYSRVTDKGFMFADIGVPPADLSVGSFPSPYTDPDPSSPTFSPFFVPSNVYTTKGVYGQWQGTIYDRVHLLAGARLANIDIEYVENLNALFGGLPQKTVTDETKVLPRAGVVVDVLDGLSVYASYSEGMRWAGFLQRPSGTIAPEESQQKEVGLKFNIGAQLSGTIAVFDIERSNVPVTTAFGAALSDQRSRGFETDLIWQPNSNWQILANYGYANTEFQDDFIDFIGGLIPAGNKVPAVPENSGRLWVNYMFDGNLKGWSAGAGIYAASGSYVDNANAWKTDSYFTVDAKIGYETDQFAASLNVKNLTEEEYFVPYTWLGAQVAPGADRQFYGTLVYKY